MGDRVVGTAVIRVGTEVGIAEGEVVLGYADGYAVGVSDGTTEGSPTIVGIGDGTQIVFVSLCAQYPLQSGPFA